jgi:hypothetical protein
LNGNLFRSAKYGNDTGTWSLSRVPSQEPEDIPKE